MVSVLDWALTAKAWPTYLKIFASENNIPEEALLPIHPLILAFPTIAAQSLPSKCQIKA